MERLQEAPVRTALAGSRLTVRMERFVPFFLSKFAHEPFGLNSCFTYVGPAVSRSLFELWSSLRCSGSLWSTSRVMKLPLSSDRSWVVNAWSCGQRALQHGMEGTTAMCAYRRTLVGHSPEGITYCRLKKDEELRLLVKPINPRALVYTVLIIDDFTNSGSTLFGAVSLVSAWASAMWALCRWGRWVTGW
eukprot:Skav236419  [mRNA]  locus=scaffold4540:135661:145351:- [translate_table: standard]